MGSSSPARIEPNGDYSCIFILGPPACGKGTLCRLAAEKLSVPGGKRYNHLSVGDYLRELCENPRMVLNHAGLDARTHRFCDEGILQRVDFDKIRDNIAENKLVPSDVLVPLLECKMFHCRPPGTWLVDGFPRSLQNALTFEKNNGMPEKVIVVECERDVAETRYLERGREPADDKNRFAQRYDDYAKNMKDIRKHYGDLIQTVYNVGVLYDCLDEFVQALEDQNNI